MSFNFMAAVTICSDFSQLKLNFLMLSVLRCMILQGKFIMEDFSAEVVPELRDREKLFMPRSGWTG